MSEPVVPGAIHNSPKGVSRALRSSQLSSSSSSLASFTEEGDLEEEEEEVVLDSLASTLPVSPKPAMHAKPNNNANPNARASGRGRTTIQVAMAEEEEILNQQRIQKSNQRATRRLDFSCASNTFSPVQWIDGTHKQNLSFS